MENKKNPRILIEKSGEELTVEFNGNGMEIIELLSTAVIHFSKASDITIEEITQCVHKVALIQKAIDGKSVEETSEVLLDMLKEMLGE